MKWDSFAAGTAVAVGILMYQWPKMKKTPKKDKWAFAVLLFIGWLLSLFNLAHAPGPATLIQTVFEPAGFFLEKGK